MWSCMPGGLREVVLSFKFRQNRLNGFRDLGGQNLPFPILKAYITACTTVQAVMNKKFSRNKRKRQPMLGRSSGNHDWLLANASDCV